MNMKKIHIVSIIVAVLSIVGAFLFLGRNTLAQSNVSKPDFRKLYRYAISTSSDAYDSFKELKQYAAQGEAIAQYYMGNIYQSDQDYQQAILWYTEAAEQGDVDAQYKLGIIYKKNKAPQQATMWFTQAVEKFRESAESGDIASQYYLGLAYDAGNGVKHDTQQALVWITKAAENGYPPAQNMLGDWLLIGYHGITQDTNKGIEWYMKAAEKHNLDAEINLYRIYGKSGSKYDPEKYVYWLHRAAEDGSTQAYWQLGRNYKIGDIEGIEQNYQQAVYWWQKGVVAQNDF